VFALVVFAEFGFLAVVVLAERAGVRCVGVGGALATQKVGVLRLEGGAMGTWSGAV
jgi:hypothetical protein